MVRITLFSIFLSADSYIVKNCLIINLLYYIKYISITNNQYYNTIHQTESPCNVVTKQIRMHFLSIVKITNRIRRMFR